MNVNSGYDLLKTFSSNSHYYFDNNGEKCGSSYLNYFDNPEQWLVFPNYGVKILVSEKDN